MTSIGQANLASFVVALVLRGELQISLNPHHSNDVLLPKSRTRSSLLFSTTLARLRPFPSTLFHLFLYLASSVSWQYSSYATVLKVFFNTFCIPFSSPCSPSIFQLFPSLAGVYHTWSPNPPAQLHHMESGAAQPSPSRPKACSTWCRTTHSLLKARHLFSVARRINVVSDCFPCEIHNEIAARSSSSAYTAEAEAPTRRVLTNATLATRQVHFAMRLMLEQVTRLEDGE